MIPILELLNKRKMRLSESGLDFIAKYEGFKPYFYDDFAPSKEYTGGEIKGTLTIGYGHIKMPFEKGKRITEKEGKRLLRQDAEIAEKWVLNRLKVPLKQNSFDMLVSHTFNTGGSKTLIDLINKQDFSKIGEWWKTTYTTSKGKFLLGLQNRRNEEYKIFSS